MNELWITQEDEEKKRRLAQLENLAAGAQEEAKVHRDVALGGTYATGLMAALIGTSEYITNKWGIKQDVETAIGALSIGIVLLEASLMRIERKIANETWQKAAHYMIEN